MGIEYRLLGPARGAERRRPGRSRQPAPAGAAGPVAGQRRNGAVDRSDPRRAVGRRRRSRQAELVVGLRVGAARRLGARPRQALGGHGLADEEPWLRRVGRPGGHRHRTVRAVRRRGADSSPRPIRRRPRRRFATGWHCGGVMPSRSSCTKGGPRPTSLVSKSSAWRRPRCESKPTCGWGCRARSSRS